MSDHEEAFDDGRDDTRYSTPVPELDDHRNQSASVQRPDHSRRGTVDTLYGQQAIIALNADLRQVNEALLHTHGEDLEEAIVDSESRGVSPLRARRNTVETQSPRSESPPNSVKAFAQARRREDTDLQRTLSGDSRRSRRSRRYTNESRRFAQEPDAVSLAASTQSAEDDVCFPQIVDAKRDKRKLYIDYDYLEKFIAEEERDRSPPKNQPAPKIFSDLRPQHSIPKIMTSDGDVIEMPSSDVSLKEKENTARIDNMDERSIAPASQADPNRFSFFSSAWESTIHAAEFGDLIMPGEDVRGLFYLPEGDQDGVWWLNMNNPEEEEIRSICKAFGIHPLTIEDIGTQETREKIELFPSYYFACFRSFHIIETDEGKELEPFNIYVIVFREGTLSFSFSPNPHAAQVRKRIAMLKDYVALSSDWICYALM